VNQKRKRTMIYHVICRLLAVLLCLTSCGGGKDSPDGGQPQDPFTVMYASQDVNLREGAGVDTAILMVVLRGKAVKVYSTTDGWSRVKYRGQDGFIKTVYLSGEKPPSYEQMARNILETMTTEEKVGQMFFLRCRKDTAVADIQTYYPGGYILFAGDIEGNTRETLKSTIQSYQDESRLGLLIGVDEEGGDVVRVSKYPEFRSGPFRSPQSLYAEGGYELIAADAKEKADLLKSLGFNVNLAPVCDVSTNPADYIFPRTFGRGAQDTAEYVKTVVEAMNASGIGCALKHFPGYGRNPDTHKGIAVDNRSYDTFVSSDFVPFQAGIEADAGSVLVSHNIVRCMDENLPASLSPAVHEILRRDLGFDGVIMTDDLSMDAVMEEIGDGESAVLAVKAGNDLILSSDFDVQIPSVLTAVKNGSIAEERIDESIIRILVWKLRLGIIS